MLRRLQNRPLYESLCRRSSLPLGRHRLLTSIVVTGGRRQQPLYAQVALQYTIAGSWHWSYSRCPLTNPRRELQLNLSLLKLRAEVFDCLVEGITDRSYRLPPQRVIGNKVLLYSLKIDVSCASFSMHVNLMTCLVAERSMKNKGFGNQVIYRQPQLLLKELRHGKRNLKKLASFFKFGIRNPSQSPSVVTILV